MTTVGNYAYAREEEVAGLVSSVFLDVRARMPFVPAIFKALAAEPVTLEAAWLQARQLYDHPQRATACERLSTLADPQLGWPAPAPVREAVAAFLADLPSMVLIVTSLALSLDGAVPRAARPAAALPAPGPLPASPVPEDRDEQPLYAEIRRVYGTEHLPSIFRALGAVGQLAEPWAAIGPYLDSAAGRERVAAVRAAAEHEVRSTFAAACCFDADTPHARATLEQFRVALPANLVFVRAASFAG